MLPAELATYLQAAGVGTAATDLFVGMMPPSPDKLVFVAETGGLEPTETMGSNTPPAWENPTIQIICRGDRPDPSKTPYIDARTKARDVWNALTLVANDDLSSTRYFRIHPLQSPFLIGIDESGRPLIGFNCMVQKVAS